MRKTPFEKRALSNINLKINEGEYLAIAGHTGSGKSTLIQIIAGLIKPTTGSVIIDNVNLSSKYKSDVREAKLKVGIIFQYPETQLFEETVEKDIAFGPRNLNLDETEIINRVDESLNLVGLSKDIKSMSPFNLSGGQKRRVAIAGILAMKPKYLILDEPTAGLDPKSRNEVMNNIKLLHDKQNMTVVLVSHSMDDIAKFADRLVVLSQGKILIDAVPREVFAKTNILKIAGLTPPSPMQILLKLKSQGFNIDTNAITIDETEEIIYNFLSGKLRSVE